MSFVLRDYQKNCIESVRNGLRNNHIRQIIMLATGSGKTAIAGTMAKSAVDKGNRVWFVVDSLELIDQAFETFERVGLDVGIIQGQHEKTDYTKQVQVITAQTLTRRWRIFDSHKEWWPKLCFIDEVHIQHQAHREIIERWPKLPIVSLSATPFSPGLGKYYSRLINPVSVSDLIKQGYLSTFEAYGPPSVSMKGVKTQGGDWVASEVEKRINKKKIVGDIVSHWLELASDRTTIVFACNIAHSKSICEQFLAAGVNSIHLDGYTDAGERKKIIEKFKAGGIQVLCSVAVLVKGFDAPRADCAILASPTKSLSRFLQCAGRVLRTHPDKKNALILDHGNNFARLGWIDEALPAYLDNGEKQEVAPKKEKDEVLPKPCPKCTYLTSMFPCPACGFVPEKPTNVEVVDGKLKKLEKVDMKEKIEFYAQLKGYAAEKGYKPGWAYWKAKEKFGVAPTRTRVTPAMKPGKEVLNWIKHINIKRAKTPYNRRRSNA